MARGSHYRHRLREDSLVNKHHVWAPACLSVGCTGTVGAQIIIYYYTAAAASFRSRKVKLKRRFVWWGNEGWQLEIHQCFSWGMSRIFGLIRIVVDSNYMDFGIINQAGYR